MVEPVSAATTGRAVCYRCYKPKLTCICGPLRRVHNQTPVWIVQHPRERFHPIGTARILALGLARVELSVCYRPSAERPAHLPAGAALLYPRRSGEGLDDLAEHALAARPTALVVLDGTWAHAHTLYRDNPWLHALPRYGIEPSQPSRYRIRREPAAHCVSTVEAVVQALELLEPENDELKGLLGVFDAMIDTQIELARSRSGGRVVRPRARRRRSGLPRVLREPSDRLVLVYGESRVCGDRRNGFRQLLQWCAWRPGSAELFDEIVRVAPNVDGRGIAETAEELLAYTDLSPADMAHGVDLAELRHAWRAYCRNDDIFVSWNQYGLDLLRLVSEDERTALLLKAAYGDYRRGQSGSLEQVLAQEDCEPLAVAARGRAGLQLGRAAALLAWLQAAAQRDESQPTAPRND